MTEATDLTPSEPVQPKVRLQSLDVFRGLTIAGMILVNNGGGNSYPPLRHAEWDGWTPTDLVFPFFLLIVGVAIPFSLGQRTEGGTGVLGLLFRILRRAIVIFGLGIILNGFPNYNWSHIRIPGVLQRIALCYLFASLLDLILGIRGKLWAVVVLLVGYFAALMFIAAPGGFAGDLSKQGSLPSWVDRTVLAGHTYKVEYDPEGILSTLPALATTLIGVLAGRWIRSGRDKFEIVAGILAVGWISLLAGWVWSAFFPINKALWTSSFVMLTAGLGLLTLGACYWLIDLKGFRCWSKPFAIFGTNAIAAYVLAAFVARGLAAKWSDSESAVSARTWIFDHVLKPNLSPANASLAWALLIVTICYLVVYLLHRNKIYIKA